MQWRNCCLRKGLTSKQVMTVGGQRALHMVAYGGHNAMVQLLFEKRADIAAKDRKGVDGAALGGLQGEGSGGATAARQGVPMVPRRLTTDQQRSI
jgi:hypothetical protein